jgi:hypothetical protein
VYTIVDYLCIAPVGVFLSVAHVMLDTFGLAFIHHGF